MADPRGHEDLEDGEIEEEEVYCICRSSNSKGFMIACDNCEEWYHGDCISITEEFGKRIDKFYCIRCRDKDPSLQTIYKEKKIKKSKPLDERKTNKTKFIDDEEDEVNMKDFLASDDDDDFEDTRKKKKATKKTIKAGRPAKKPKTESRYERSRTKVESRGTRRSRDHHADHHHHEPRQCYGPACTNAARRSSKYCSDECGLKLAKNRIIEILPERIKQWQSNPSIADEMSSKALDKIHQEQLEARKQLEALDARHEALDKLIEMSKQTKPFTEEEEEEYEDQLEAEADLTSYCVTCGHEVNNKIALRHMERCFNKYESQTSLGSIFKTKIDNLFCDVFNPHTKTYCKRLRVLCPEHLKDPKIGDDEVCGFPLVSSEHLFKETGDFCRVNKKKCIKHLGWEKLRRALIDMERVQQWLRIDELFEKEQKTRYLMACRGNLLALMLHQTIPAASGSPTQ